MKLRKCPGHDDCIIVDDVHTDKSKVGEYSTEVIDKDARDGIAELGTRIDKRFDDFRRHLETQLTELASVVGANHVAVARLEKESRQDISTIKLDLAGMNERVERAKSDYAGRERKEVKDVLTKEEGRVLAKRISDLVDAFTKLTERVEREEIAREAGDRK